VADGLEFRQGQPAGVAGVEQPEARIGRRAKFVGRNAAVEVGVGRCDGFGNLQQAEAAGGGFVAGQTARRDDGFVMSDLVGVDFTVVVGVEGEEEALGVAGELIGGQDSVVIGIRLLEPHGQAILALSTLKEWLAHRTHEQPALESRGRKRRIAGWRARRLRCRGRKDEDQRNSHHAPSRMPYQVRRAR